MYFTFHILLRGVQFNYHSVITPQLHFHQIHHCCQQHKLRDVFLKLLLGEEIRPSLASIYAGLRDVRIHDVRAFR